MRPSLLAPLALALTALPSLAAAQAPAYPPPPPLDPAPSMDYAAPAPAVVASTAPPMGYRLGRPLLVPYEEGAPVPPGGRVITRPRVGLIVAGASVFGSLWLLTAMAGSLSSLGSSSRSSQPELWLTLPVLGPVAFIAATDHVSGGAAFWLVFDALAQAGGLAMLIGGIANPGHYVAYDRVAAARPRWTISPGFAGGPGASLHMTF